MINLLPLDKKIILFDGVCNLCNSAIQYVIKHDKTDQFRFVSLQSDLGQEVINYLGIDSKSIDSIILYEPNKAYFIKADAAMRIAKYLGGIVSVISLFQFVPPFIKNSVYDFIAKNRYKWYGKQESCMIPTPELKSKFL
ncbi:thiol-disulfide oxidoreductase DCC family protein [Flavobacterium sp. '19STA2R22 D10 B1']|uniref:thiol-disulfide oxidoreductase DCC family protein n=1 Tax=Flavobacterium aerium TaxID=3037261 RepID=UPI00278BD57B|nr:DUF393 domain-containing protein [Flavobacterium sp. '19STA2R22 D10 B1']